MNFAKVLAPNSKLVSVDEIQGIKGTSATGTDAAQAVQYEELKNIISSSETDEILSFIVSKDAFQTDNTLDGFFDFAPLGENEKVMANL